MENQELIANLIGKDEVKACAAAAAIVNSSNEEAFALLAEKMDFLFSFVKENVIKRLNDTVNSNNFRNLFPFLNHYSADLEDFIVTSLASFANEDLTDEILNLLQNGSDAQKTYCAKYFYYIPDTVAAEFLEEYAFSDDESLAFNAAQALGTMSHELSYKMALEMLNTKDDFVILKVIKFLVAYANPEAVDYMFDAMKKSAMHENIAGEIPFLVSPMELLRTKDITDVMIMLHYLVEGFGEILPLNQVFAFQLYDVFAELIERNKKEKRSEIAGVLLQSASRFKLICSRDEYTFDEEKHTKQELNDIFELLVSQGNSFWEEQADLIIQELDKGEDRALFALQVISEQKIEKAYDKLVELLMSENEIVICEAICTLKALGKLESVTKDNILEKMTDENKIAIVKNCF